MKKAFNFRSAIVCVLVLIMCLMAFVACDKDKGEQPNNGLTSAKDYVKALYINKNTETAADYTVVSKVNIGGVFYSVSWTVTIKTEGASVDSVKVVPGTDSVTIDVIDMAENDIEYTLTATVSDANGNTETVSFDRKVPKFKVSTWAEYAAAEDGKLLVVDGVVTMFTSKSKNASYNTMYIQDDDGAYYAYSMDEDPAAKNIAVGMTVRLTGTKATYNGTLELTGVLIKEVLDTNIKTVEPADITEIFKSSESVKAKALTNTQGRLVTIKNAIAVEVDEDQKYCYFTVDGLKSYIRPSASAGFLTSDQIKTFMADFKKNLGHVVTVSGQALVYNSAFYMQPIATDAVVYGDVADLNPAEQVKFVKDNANPLTDVTYSGYSVTLPSVSTIFADVKIAWSVDNKDICTIADGKATFTYDYTTAGRKVKLTATYTHATDTTVAALTNEYTLELLIPQDVTVKEFLDKDEDDSVYKLTGTIVAKQKDGKENGAFVLADETGAVFSYNGTTEELGSVVTVYAKRTSNYTVPQLGTISVSVVEGGKAYTPEVDMTIDMKDFDWTTKVTEYTGKLIKITGLTVVSGEKTDRIYLSSDGTKADLNAFTLKKEFVDMAKLGEKVVVYGYCRGLNTSTKGSENFQIQLVKVEYGYSDAQKVEKAKEALTTAEIGGTEFDKDFVLPLEGVYGTTISWAVKGESNYVAINGANATVTKPETERETVTIVATIKSGEVTDTKEFEIAILGATPSYAVNWTDAALTAVYGEGGTALAAGGEVEKGTVVTFTVALPADKVVKSVSVNGAEDTSFAYKTTFTVTVNAETTVVVNYNDYTVSTVANVINATDTTTLYKVTGYVVAFGADAGEAGAYAIADESGAVMSFVKAALAVGDYVTVYGTKSVDKYDFISIGVQYVEKLEGGSYVEPTPTVIETKDVDYDKDDKYIGKYYKVINGSIVVDGNFINFVAENDQKLSLYAGDAMKEELKALAGKEVEIYGVSRSINAKTGYWGVQVARYHVVTDEEKVAAAKEVLALENTTLGAGEITLPATGINGTTITWTSDNAAIAIAEDGVTATIVAGESDITVNLTATITLGEASVTKVIPVTVTAKTPEYTVTFVEEADNGTMVEITVDGVAIATGAKVEQGKTLTITVVIDDANYTLVAVKANGTALVEAEGVYTYQVTGDVEITVEVKSNKGTSAEKAYTVAEIIEATKDLKTNEYTESMVYVKGIIKSCEQGSYIKNIYLVDAADSTQSFLVYSCNFANGVTAAYTNDTVVIYGAVTNYKGTIEMSNVKSGDTTIHGFPTFVSRVAGQGSIVIGEKGNSTVVVTDDQTTGLNDSTFTFTVTPESGYEIVSVKVNGVVVESAEGVYTGTIAGVTTITVETKAEGAADPVLAATISFSNASNKTTEGSNQKWVENNITFVTENNNYSNPVRIYKGKTATLSYTAMVKVVFHCNTTAYATSLGKSISGSVVSGKDVTVTFAEAKDTYSFTTSDGQVRVDSIDVYTMA